MTRWWDLACFSALRELVVRAGGVEGDGDRMPSRDELTAWLELRSLASDAGPTWRLTRNPARRHKPRDVDETYDGLVRRGWIPTRDRCWHDVFNVAAFATFPRTKAAINARQWEALDAPAERELLATGRRSRRRDALALIDEGGIILATTPETFVACRQAVEHHDLELLRSFHREGRVRPWVLGHALLEHAVRTYFGEDLGPAPRGLPLPVAVEPADASDAISAISAIDDVDIVDERFAAWVRTEVADPPSYAGIALSHWFPDTPIARPRA